MINPSLLQTGSAGVQAGLRQAEQAAGNIARLNTADITEQKSGGDIQSLTESTVELLEAENQVKASAKLIAVADELLGTVIDTLA